MYMLVCVRGAGQRNPSFKLAATRGRVVRGAGRGGFASCRTGGRIAFHTGSAADGLMPAGERQS